MRREKNSLLLYYDFEEQTASLTDQQVGRLIRTILAYERRGELLEDQEPAVTMAFLFLKPGLDNNRLKYEKVCERNRRNRQKRDQSSPVVTGGTDTEPEKEPEPDREPDPEPDPDTEREREKEREKEKRNWIFEIQSQKKGTCGTMGG